MPTLSDTQSPFLERDVKCGLLPSKLPDDTEDSYISRLVTIYHAPREAVMKALGKT